MIKGSFKPPIDTVDKLLRKLKRTICTFHKTYEANKLLKKLEKTLTHQQTSEDYREAFLGNARRITGDLTRFKKYPEDYELMELCEIIDELKILKWFLDSYE